MKKKQSTTHPCEVKIGRTDVQRMLGLAARAGRIVAGSEAAVKALRSNKAYLVLLAEDAADNTVNQFVYAAEKSNKPLCRFGKKSELGQWTGSDNKAVLAVTDKGFASRLRELIEIVGNDVEEQHPAEMENNMSS